MKIDIREFEFNNRTYFITVEPYNEQGFRKIWTENTITYAPTMKIKFRDIGENRWLCYAYVTKENAREFEAWLKEALDGRYKLDKEYNHHDGHLHRTFIIRGGDVRDKTLITLRWK
jgi:hypothetical protein